MNAVTEKPANDELGSWQAAWLVAGRELTTRLRAKTFIISTVVMLLLLVGTALTVKLISGSAVSVGFTSQTASLAAPLQTGAQAGGRKVTTHTVSDEAAGRRQVSDGTLDALVIGDGGQLRVVVKKTIDTNLKNDLNALAGQLALDQQIAKLGGDPQAVLRAVAAAKVTVAPLEPPHQYQTQQLLLGVIAGALIYMGLMLYGPMVAQGVVEEKSSRVVELLLSTIRPWQLMAGKVLGIGVVGLIQMVILGTGGMIAGLATGALTISVSAATGTVVWLVVWYLLGFFAYALVLAAAGALVSRQEDVNGVVMPILMVVIVGWVIGISVLPSNPSSPLCEVLSIIPLFAPSLMPMRLAMGGVPAWEAALAVVLMVATIPALVWLSGRVYRNAVMRTGARVKLSEALRAA